MDQRPTDRPPFDERAALAELERLREQIALRRRERKATSEEFDRFVKSFRKRPARPAEAAAERPEPSARRMAQPAPPVAASGPASHEARAVVAEPTAIPSEPIAIPSGPIPAGPIPSEPIPAEPIAIPPESMAIPPEPIAIAAEPIAIRSEPIPAEPMDIPPEPIPKSSAAAPIAPATPQARSRARLLGGGALMLAVAGGLAAWTLRHRAPEPPPPSTTVSSPTPAAPVAAPAPAAAPAEVVTSRRVWMRILADGERVLEREVPADTRLPVNAQRTIVIRTGDAGAVRVTIQGRDQGPLGRAGEVVTRSFAIQAADER